MRNLGTEMGTLSYFCEDETNALINYSWLTFSYYNYSVIPDTVIADTVKRLMGTTLILALTWNSRIFIWRTIFLGSNYAPNEAVKEAPVEAHI